MDITGEAFLATDDPASFSRALLGEGCYGKVHATDDPTKVVKSGTRTDDGWPHYALWTMQEDRGPYAMKVHAFRCSADGSEYFALLDRYETTVGHARSASFAGEYRDTLDDLAVSFSVYPDHTGAKDRNNARHPGFSAFMVDLYATFKHDFSFDCHAGNIMLRMDGSPVVTDAVGYSSSGSRRSATSAMLHRASSTPRTRIAPCATM